MLTPTRRRTPSIDLQAIEVEMYALKWGGPEQLRTGAWHIELNDSKELALQMAFAKLRSGYIVNEMRMPNGSLWMDEEAIRERYATRLRVEARGAATGRTQSPTQ